MPPPWSCPVRQSISTCPQCMSCRAAVSQSTQYCNRFLSLVLQTESIKYQVELSVIGGTIPTISQEKILNYIMPLPSEKEQNKIVEWIQETIEPIQSVIDKIKNKISLLQERKQIIINDVVTGKVKLEC